MKKGTGIIRTIVAFCMIFCAGPCILSALTFDGAVAIGDNIMPDMSKAFEAKTGIKFTSIKSGGTDVGFKSAMDGTIDVGGVARKLTADEKNAKPYYQIVGYDAIAIFVHKNNPIKGLTSEQIKSIFLGKIKNWKEVGWKDAPIIAVCPDKTKRPGIVGNFVNLLMSKVEPTNAKVFEGSHAHAEYLEKTENAITFDSFSFTSNLIKPIMIDGVEANTNNISSGDYPVSLPLILITKKVPSGDLKKFFDFVLSDDGQAIIRKKFVAVK